MHIAKNEKGRDFIIGDLHGCYDLLQDRLWRVRFDYQTDRLFSVGDLIDRGPDSFKCLQLIQEAWFYPVIGNHEQMMLDVILNKQDSILWIQNGGAWILDKYRISTTYLKHLCKKLYAEVPYSYTIDNKIGICHAQPPSINWQDAEILDKGDKQTMLWGRSWINDLNLKNVENIRMTFHGHTIIESPRRLGNVNFIDTGAFHTGNLTLLEIKYHV